ncbi:unnamed protein product [Ceutorhynchus assimilis]|uniref:Uncharacterized protein n=1 Tax=Ceutorhynchus assimilis TaxID=467358 RepID=A0A9P0GRD2_9CUCU|nr:unnamed protein product [Ceutorhynchus assimilis]
MLKLLLLMTGFSLINAGHISKISSEVTVLNVELLRNEPLHIQGYKKISKAQVEHLILTDCKGVIDAATFKHFPKLQKLTLWRSNIEEITTNIPITHLVSMGSHLPSLNEDLQQKLPKLQSLLLMGNKNVQVDPMVFKNFRRLRSLHISEANFTRDCITKYWFKGMDLEELGLSDNNISCMSEDAFDSLKSLRKLDLTYNHIPYLERKVFKKLTKLEQLGLYENHLDRLELGSLASQKNHLERFGISWDVLKNSNIEAEDLVHAFPKLKHVSFGHDDMPNDFSAGIFCQILRQNDVSCEVDSVFGYSKIFGYYSI